MLVSLWITPRRSFEHEQFSGKGDQHAAAVVRDFEGGNPSAESRIRSRRAFSSADSFSWALAEQLGGGCQDAFGAGGDVEFVEIALAALRCRTKKQHGITGTRDVNARRTPAGETMRRGELLEEVDVLQGRAGSSGRTFCRSRADFRRALDQRLPPRLGRHGRHRQANQDRCGGDDDEAKKTVPRLHGYHFRRTGNADRWLCFDTEFRAKLASGSSLTGWHRARSANATRVRTCAAAGAGQVDDLDEDSGNDRDLCFQRFASRGAARKFVAGLVVKISTKGDSAWRGTCATRQPARKRG